MLDVMSVLDLLPFPRSALKLFGPIYNYYEARTLAAQTKEKGRQIKVELASLEDALSGVQTDVCKSRQQNWPVLGKQLSTAINDVEELASGVGRVELYKYKTWRDRAAAAKSKAQATNEIANYVEPLRQAVALFRQDTKKVSEAEIVAVGSYVRCLNDCLARGEKDVASAIETLESEFKGTIISKKSKAKRLALQQGSGTTAKEKGVPEEVFAYVSTTYDKFRRSPPDVSPSGDYAPDSSWNARMYKPLFGGGLLATGKNWRAGLQLICKYNATLQVSPQFLMKEAKRASSWKNNSAVLCIVKKEAADAEKTLVEKFSNPHLLVYLYETGANGGVGKLTYNKAAAMAEGFAAYFDAAKKPTLLHERLYALPENITTLALKGLGLSERGILQLQKRGMLFNVGYGGYVLCSKLSEPAKDTGGAA